MEAGWLVHQCTQHETVSAVLINQEGSRDAPSRAQFVTGYGTEKCPACFEIRRLKQETKAFSSAWSPW